MDKELYVGLIGKDAYLYKNQYRFCTIGIDSPQIYDLKFE